MQLDYLTYRRQSTAGSAQRSLMRSEAAMYDTLVNLLQRVDPTVFIALVLVFGFAFGTAIVSSIICQIGKYRRREQELDFKRRCFSAVCRPRKSNGGWPHQVRLRPTLQYAKQHPIIKDSNQSDSPVRLRLNGSTLLRSSVQFGQLPKMYACPHCGKPGISFWRKMFLGPAIPAKCRACGKLVGVPWSSMILLIPVFALAILAGYAPSFWLKSFLILCSFVVAIAWSLWTPMIQHEEK